MAKSLAAVRNVSLFSNVNWEGAKPLPFLSILTFAMVLWFLPTPAGLEDRTWHLFVIFISTIISIIAKPLPMGSIAIVVFAICTMTKTLTLQQTLSSFSSKIVWLVVIAFLIARSFIKTGFGSRIAYCFVALTGKSTLGLGYGLIATEFLLAPFIPSNTARGAGIIFPIVNALCKEYDSDPSTDTHKKIGSFLIKLCYQANTITSAMFLTALAGNPLVASLASKVGVEITWASWAWATIVPGLINLLILPLVIYRLCPPELTSTPEAPAIARKKLEELGPLKAQEITVLGTFALLLFLWIFGGGLGIDATSAALVGLAVLLFTGVLTWQDIMNEYNAWNAFIWLSCLLMLAHYLTEFGMIEWMSDHMQVLVSSFDWVSALMVLSAIYFCSHYLFASITSHITSMYSAFLLVAIASGAPPALVAMALAVLSSLSAGLTHYGTGTGPVFFGAGFVGIKQWWRVGAIVGAINLLIWLVCGGLWWKAIGLW